MNRWQLKAYPWLPGQPRTAPSPGIRFKGQEGAKGTDGQAANPPGHQSPFA